MIERDLKIKMGSGVADAAFFAPDGNQHYPGIIFLADIRGLRQSNRERSRKLAAAGFTVLDPNIFYRFGPPPVFDFEFKGGTPATMQRMGELTQPLTPSAIAEDARCYIDALLAQPETRPGAIGIVGHCFSGSMALRIAAAYPETVRAMASFHGGRLVDDTPNSPHLLLSSKLGRLLFEHAENDKSMPPEMIEKFDGALAASGVKYESRTIHGARHGWTTSDHEAYSPQKADEAFADMVELFTAALK